MRSYDLFAHVCNAALVVTLLVVIAGPDYGAGGLSAGEYLWLLLIGATAPVASSVALWERAKGAGDRAALPSLSVPDLRRRFRRDEMDAREALEIDQRLDALERAQADAEDAARWRALVESGQVSGPAAGLEGDRGLEDGSSGRAPEPGRVGD